MPKRILITGVAGHIGSCFCKWVIDNHPDYKIVGIDDLSCGYYENIPPSIQFIPIDVASYNIINDFDYIFHFAAFAAECLSPFVRCYNYNNNIISTANLINNIILNSNCKRLIFASSMAVYGHAKVPFDESQYCLPADPYGVAKLACEHDIRIAGEQHGIDWCIVRPHNIYGPYQSLWQKYRNVFGLWMRETLENRPISIFGDGSQIRAFTYIDDILPCLWAAATEPQASKQIINLGGATPTTIENAANIFNKLVGNYISYVGDRYEVKEAWCTTSKSIDILGYSDTIELSHGLEQMWTWAVYAWVKYPTRRELPDFFNIEINNGLPNKWKRK